MNNANAKCMVSGGQRSNIWLRWSWQKLYRLYPCRIEPSKGSVAARLNFGARLLILSLVLSAASAFGQAAPDGVKQINPTWLKGEFSWPRQAERRKLGEPAGVTKAGDHYLRRAGEEIQLLRATGEAALLLREGTDAGATLRDATNRVAVVAPQPGALAQLSGGRQLVLVRSADIGDATKAPDRVALQALPGVFAVQPVLVDPESRLRMIPSGSSFSASKPASRPRICSPTSRRPVSISSSALDRFA